MYKAICFAITFFLAIFLKADVKIFDINDYVINLENNRIEHIHEDGIFKHSYEDSLRLSISTELIEYKLGVFPLFVKIDSMETILVDANINIPKYIETEWNKVQKYNNNPIKLGGKGTLRHKYLAVLESFPFIFKDDSLFFTPRIEYTYVDTFISPETKYSISEKIDMVIITKEELVDAFEPFRIFKNKMGLNTKIKTVEEIYQEYQGENDVIKIRHYIQDIYNKNDLEYVIIGGSHSVIPVGYAKPEDDAERVCTDSFYSNLDGVVDKNGNGKYFELFDYPDFYADVYVGRFPGSNQAELQSIINKQIDYFTGNGNQRLGFNTSLFLTGLNIFSDGDGEKWCEKVKDEFPSYFDTGTLYEETSPEFNQQTLINALDLGYNFYYHQSHGDYNKVGQNENKWALWSDHFYGFSAISGLYLIASCHPGDIVYSGLSQKAMINPNGGCVNYIGSSGEDYPNTSISMHTTFYNNIFKGKDIGESLVYANLLSYGNLLGFYAGRLLNYSYNIQGDPSNKLFLREPRNINILGISQFKKGQGTVNGVFNMISAETVEITLISDGEIVSRTSTDNQSFTLEYNNLFSDSVYVYYHSQESYLKEYGYLVHGNDSIEIEVSDLSIGDTNNTTIAECGDDFVLNFNMNVSLNSSNLDSILVYVSDISDSNLTVLSDSIKINVPDINTLTGYSVFDFEYNPTQRSKQDSVVQMTIYFEIDEGEIVYQQELFIPVADPVLKLQSILYLEDNVLPTFINNSKGLIEKAEIRLIETIKNYTRKVKTAKTLYDIQGLTTIQNDTLAFATDSTKTYFFEITINDEYVYNTSEFKVNNDTPEDIIVYADHSPGKVNLNWTYENTDNYKYNVYIDTNSEFSSPILSNFELLSINEYFFNNDQISTLYAQIAIIDTNNVELLRSDIKQIGFIPLYQNTKFKISPYAIYNPMYIDSKLISNVQNSSVSGINEDGSLINGNGVIHEAEVNGFSTARQQGFAIGDVNGDGFDDMVNYSYNLGDSVLVKVISLLDGTLLASKNIYGHIQENAPVLVDYDLDQGKEIMISVFNGNIGHTSPIGSYVYMLEFDSGNLSLVSGFPLYSLHSAYNIHSPSLIDLDGSGAKEIIFDNLRNILIYDASTLDLIVDHSLSYGVQTSLSYCDLDGDGNVEIFTITESDGKVGKLYGFNYDGSSLNEIPVISGGISLDMKPYGFYDLNPPVSFADIDDDYSTDIVALTASKLYIYDDQFTPRTNFPVALDSRIAVNNSSAPSFGDLNGDSVLDILFMDANYRVWCYSGSTGEILEGFPIQIEDMTREQMTALSIMDIDGDNDLEFAIGVDSGAMLVYDCPTTTTRLDTYDKYRGDQYNSGLFSNSMLGTPSNITTELVGSDINISWDPVVDATSYKIFVSDEPYTGFIILDETNNTNYVIYDPTDMKKFYYIIAVK